MTIGSSMGRALRYGASPVNSGSFSSRDCVTSEHSRFVFLCVHTRMCVATVFGFEGRSPLTISGEQPQCLVSLGLSCDLHGKDVWWRYV